jgi:hypothetical protein
MFIFIKHKSVAMVLDIIDSAPEKGYASLIVLGIDNVNCMEVDGKFDCGCWSGGAAIL